MESNARQLRPVTQSHPPDFDLANRRLPILQDSSDLDASDPELQDRFMALSENPSDLIWELDHQFIFTYASQNFRPILHYKPSQLLGQTFLDFVHEEDAKAVSSELATLLHRTDSTRLLFRLRNGENDWRWLDCSAKAYCAHGGGSRAIFIGRDVTDRQRLEVQRALLATRDHSTILYNKPYFVEQLLKAIQAAKHGELSAVIYIDLDNFKRINDRCGHLAGDRLIVAIANLLHEATPENGILARFGGDEFLLLLRSLDKEEDAVQAAEEILKRLAGYHFIEGGHSYAVGASLGIVPVSAGANTRRLLDEANAASTAAKAMGGNRVQLYQPAIESARKQLRADRVADALKRGAMELWYRPVVYLGSGKVHHVEAVVHSHDEEGNHVSSADLWSEAARLGSWSILDRYALEESARCIFQGLCQRIALTVSPSFLAAGDATTVVQSLIDRYGFSGEQLILLIPWTPVLETLEPVQETIRALRAMHVQIGISHFRADFAAVHLLRHLPVDYLKLDAELMRNLVNSPLNQAIITGIREISRAVNAQLIADCVHNQSTLELLRKIGVDYAEGDVIGPARARLATEEG